MRYGMIYTTLILLSLSSASAFTTPRQKVVATRGNVRMNSSPFGGQHISVAIDHPLVETSLFTKGSAAGRGSIKAILASAWSAITSNSLRLALIAFVLAMAFTATTRGPSAAIDLVKNFAKTIFGRVERVVESVGKPAEGVPMPFEDSIDGWGVCTLKSRKRLGDTDFVEYDFALPKREYELPLSLGQQVSLMCLDNDSNVARGDFYPFSLSPKQRLGTFSILVPDKPHEHNVEDIGLDAANFVRIMNEEMKIGDEIALQPGSQKLKYKGQYLPVTDMVYIAYGTGIAPILEQIRAVLSDSSSSVDAVTLIWINEDTDDFDVTAKTLEKEYYKYSNKLAVSCLVDRKGHNLWGKNQEIDNVLPAFKPGAMAVLSGPSQMMRKGADYLESNFGYPTNTICLM